MECCCITCHRHEGERCVWVLCENTPVVVSTHSLRPANDSEALTRAIRGNRSPGEIIGEDQRFVDARLPDPEAPEDAVPTIPEDEEVNPASKMMTRLTRMRLNCSATFGPNVPRNVRARTETGLSTDEGSGSVPGTPADCPIEIPGAPVLEGAVLQESEESRTHAVA